MLLIIDLRETFWILLLASKVMCKTYFIYRLTGEKMYSIFLKLGRCTKLCTYKRLLCGGIKKTVTEIYDIFLLLGNFHINCII